MIDKMWKAQNSKGKTLYNAWEPTAIDAFKTVYFHLNRKGFRQKLNSWASADYRILNVVTGEVITFTKEDVDSIGKP